MRILVTGSRRWVKLGPIHDALGEYAGQPDVTVVHGAAPGADRIAAAYARALGFKVEPHPALWRTLGKRAGPLRNQHMVDLGADVCLAFPDEDSVGTWGCMKMADQAGIPVINHGVQQ